VEEAEGGTEAESEEEEKEDFYLNYVEGRIV
jgi:hypothetical protein